MFVLYPALHDLFSGLGRRQLLVELLVLSSTEWWRFRRLQDLLEQLRPKTTVVNEELVRRWRWLRDYRPGGSISAQGLEYLFALPEDPSLVRVEVLAGVRWMRWVNLILSTGKARVQGHARGPTGHDIYISLFLGSLFGDLREPFRGDSSLFFVFTHGVLQGGQVETVMVAAAETLTGGLEKTLALQGGNTDSDITMAYADFLGDGQLRRVAGSGLPISMGEELQQDLDFTYRQVESTDGLGEIFGHF